MTGAFLLPESTITQQGSGEPLKWVHSKALVTLGILSVEEQESLQVSLWESTDGSHWSATPILQFSQKFYTGTYQMVLQPEGPFLQARWHVNRWGRGDLTPRFTFYVFIEPLP